LKAKFKEIFVKLLKLNTTPPEIALGISIGVIIAVLPLCVIFAFFIPRANKIAILVGTNISLPPTVPFITWAGYNIGRLILGPQYAPLNLATFKGIRFKDMLHFYYPLFVGSLVLGLFLSVIFYFFTLRFIKKRRNRARP